MGILDRLFSAKKKTGSDPNTTKDGLRPVEGAASFSYEGEVIYNLLTPHMQQFMGRCIGAVKKKGIQAKGTGHFSILLGEDERELALEPFYEPNDDPSLVERVVNEAKTVIGA